MNQPGALTLANLIPQPETVRGGEGMGFLNCGTRIEADLGVPQLAFAAHYLRQNLPIPVDEPGSLVPEGFITHIRLKLAETPTIPGAEAYRLRVEHNRISLTASTPGGIFMGVQTLLQLVRPLPDEPDVCRVPLCEIEDRPRFAWRGMMLDVARHFFPPADVRRVIDLLARYKFNRLHLHLTDDQGWRIEIKSWPELTRIGSQTAVGGGRGGFYTQEDYAGLVDYAQQRGITIVPEIDLPGHTNAALASYPELNADGVAPELYTGIEVGFSSLAVDKPITYRFLEDVLGELAALTPGPYLHIGGDEAKSTRMEDYKPFIEKVQAIVSGLGKQIIGWQEIAHAVLEPGSVIQYWTHEAAVGPLPKGVGVVMSPAQRAYLDMMYHAESPLGLKWAGYVTLQDAYTWDPQRYLDNMPPEAVLGVEAALWSETLETVSDIEFMLFPRLLALAEIGWARRAEPDFETFRKRVAAHGKLLDRLGVHYYRSKEIDWD